MPVLEFAGTGKCRCWNMPVAKKTILENAGLPALKCWYWKMPVLENAGTGVLPRDFVIGCELVCTVF